MKIFTERLESLMLKHKIGHNELAEKLGVTRQTVRNYLKEKVSPDINILMRICDVFKITPNDILLQSTTDYLVKKYAGEVESSGINEETITNILNDNKRLSEELRRKNSFIELLKRELPS